MAKKGSCIWRPSDSDIMPLCFGVFKSHHVLDLLVFWTYLIWVHMHVGPLVMGVSRLHQIYDSSSVWSQLGNGEVITLANFPLPITWVKMNFFYANDFSGMNIFPFFIFLCYWSHKYKVKTRKKRHRWTVLVWNFEAAAELVCTFL